MHRVHSGEPTMTTGHLKLCVGASSGGHMNQLLILLDHAGAWPVKPAFYVTTLNAVVGRLKDRGRVYVLGEANRHHPFKALLVLWRSFRIILIERPELVVTTGSMPLALFCLVAKCTGARILWIESIANINRLSASGRLAKTFADLVLTQWPELATPDGRVQYVGELL